ncbi:hypothetical protein ISG10_05305 [Burkholderia pseudomallei]|nr:hypothetical protein [Burkholderia pseudomallei]MBF3599278.1 hypothetical protein [Burkholderia pseudomallei]
MNADLVKGIGATAGVAGVAIGMLVQVFRPILHKSVLSSMSRTQAYSLLRLIVIGCLVVAVAGILAWSFAPGHKQGGVADGAGVSQNTTGPQSPAISGVTGDVTINNQGTSQAGKP